MSTSAMLTSYIGGAFREGTGPDRLTVVNPATEDVIAEGPVASRDEAKMAVEAARTAFDAGPWPRLSPAERGGYISRMADGLESRQAQLIDLAVREVGTPVLLADFVQIQAAVDTLRYWADRASTFAWEEAVPPAPGSSFAITVVKEPAGVVAALTPFNVPLLLATFKVGPALVAGNTMVVKPSPYTPLLTIALAEAAHEAGLPPGVFNVVIGDTAVGEELTVNPDVDIVSFTGSDTVGRRIMAQASASLKRVVLELGGKSANILLDDVDLDDPGLLAHVVGNFVSLSGQGCGLATRILVPHRAHDALVTRLQAALAAVPVGDPADPAVVMGPLIREAQRTRVERYVRLGREEGAVVAFGGGRPARDQGFFVEPTLFTGVDNAMTIARDEIFGPVGVVIPYEDDADAVRIANDSPFGLAGSVWSADPRRAHAVGNRLRVGYVTVNGGDGTALGPLPRAPYGGYKQSGIGREGGDAGLLEYLELKTVFGPAPE